MGLKWVEDIPWAGHNLVLTPGDKHCAHIARCWEIDDNFDRWAADMLNDMPLYYFDTLDEAKAFVEGVYALEQ